MGTWFNPDGLFIKFGSDKTTPNRGGEYKTYGDVRELEFKVIFGTASTVGSSTVGTVAATDVIQSDQVFFPKGVWLEEVQVDVLEAFNTVTSISVGMVQTNDRSTLIGAAGAGFVSALVVASLTPAGARITLVGGSTSAGSLIGTVPIAAAATFTGHVTARFTGTQGTTGAANIRIKYRPLQQ